MKIHLLTTLVVASNLIACGTKNAGSDAFDAQMQASSSSLYSFFTKSMAADSNFQVKADTVSKNFYSTLFLSQDWASPTTDKRDLALRASVFKNLPQLKKNLLAINNLGKVNTILGKEGLDFASLSKQEVGEVLQTGQASLAGSASLTDLPYSKRLHILATTIKMTVIAQALSDAAPPPSANLLEIVPAVLQVASRASSRTGESATAALAKETKAGRTFTRADSDAAIFAGGSIDTPADAVASAKKFATELGMTAEETQAQLDLFSAKLDAMIKFKTLENMDATMARELATSNAIVEGTNISKNQLAFEKVKFSAWKKFAYAVGSGAVVGSVGAGVGIGTGIAKATQGR